MDNLRLDDLGDFLEGEEGWGRGPGYEGAGGSIVTRVGHVSDV